MSLVVQVRIQKPSRLGMAFSRKGKVPPLFRNGLDGSTDGSTWRSAGFLLQLCLRSMMSALQRFHSYYIILYSIHIIICDWRSNSWSMSLHFEQSDWIRDFQPTLLYKQNVFFSNSKQLVKTKKYPAQSLKFNT